MRDQVIILSDAEARDIAAVYRSGDAMHRFAVSGAIDKRLMKQELQTELLIQREDADAVTQLRALLLYVDYYGSRPAEAGWEPPGRYR